MHKGVSALQAPYTTSFVHERGQLVLPSTGPAIHYRHTNGQKWLLSARSLFYGDDKVGLSQG